MDREHNQNQSTDEWNERLDTALKNLPELSAPEDLLPLVMAKIQDRRKEKLRRRSWGEWPLWLRLSSSALALLLIGYLSSVGFEFYETRLIPVFSRAFQNFLTIGTSFDGILGELRVVQGSKVLQYALIAVSLLLSGMYLSCIGLGTFIYRTVRR